MNDKYTTAPHRPVTQQTPIHNAALLIDFDNVTMTIRSNLAVELRKLLDSDIIRGKVSVQRAYADWRRYPQYVVPLSEASIDLIFAPAYGSTKKNATDIRLAIDALEIVFTRPEIGTFILLSGDSDFSSMVLKLKEYGKYVIGVGLQESASDLLVQNCDEYYSYSSLGGMTSFADMQRESLGPWELCERAIERMIERGDVMRSDRLKQVMIELDPSFDEKALGFTKFNRYLSEASSRGLITLRKLQNGQFEVGAPSAKPAVGAEPASDYAEGPATQDVEAAASKPRRGRGRRGGRRSQKAVPDVTEDVPDAAEDVPDVKEIAEVREISRKRAPEGRARGAGFGLKEAYALLRDVVGALPRGDDGVRDSEVKREMLKQRPEFDEEELGFSKFSRFLKQAHDEEIVNVNQGEDGNFRIAPLETHEPERKPARRGRRGRKKESELEPVVEEAAVEHVEEGAGAEHVDEAAGEEPARARREKIERPTRSRQGRRLGLAHRRGSRGVAEPPFKPSREQGPAEQSEQEPVPEPSAQGALELESRAAEVPSAETRPPSRSGGLSRFRRGARGRGPGPAPKGAAVEEPAQVAEAMETAESVGPAESAGPSESGDAPADRGDAQGRVDHMVRNYKGVGRKTAEALVDELGTAVFDVIDDDPERIRSILPGRRAEAVISAREAERGRK